MPEADQDLADVSKIEDLIKNIPDALRHEIEREVAKLNSEKKFWACL